MDIRHDLKHSILSMMKHNRDGSQNTQGSRRKRLMMVADQLVDDGYQLPHAWMLKPKHIKHLVDRWLQQGLSAGTIKLKLKFLLSTICI